MNCCYYNDDVLSTEWKDYEYVDVGDLCDAKMHECTVMSSHNSVIDDFQVLSAANINSLMEVLNLNFRMIELDLFKSHTSDEPVVAHGNLEKNLQGTSSIPFEDCIELIGKYGWKCTNLPLFIIFEMNIRNSDTATLKRVEEIVHKYLGDRILRKSNKLLRDYTIGDMAGKVVILPTSDRREFSFTFATLYGSGNFHNLSEKSGSRRTDRLTRVYPANTIVSVNYNWSPFIRDGAQFVTMNATYKDKYLKDYMKYFHGNGIVKL